MNVLHVTQRYYPSIGGSELYIKQLSEYIAENTNSKVTVLTTDTTNVDDFWKTDYKSPLPKKEIINGVEVKRNKITPYYKFPPFIIKIIRKLLYSVFKDSVFTNYFDPPVSSDMLKFVNDDKRSKYDIVHVTPSPYGFPYLIASKIAKKDNAKLFITPFFHLGTKKYPKIREQFFQKRHLPIYIKADRIFVVTKAEKQAFYKFVKSNGYEDYDKSKIVNVGYGLKLDDYTKYSTNRFRKKHNFKHSIIFYVGTQNIDKGTANLVKACRILHMKGIKFHLVLAGKVTDEFRETYEKNKEMIIELGRISEREKQELFSSGDIFCMVSRSDSFGIVYLESWFYNIPVIACDTPVFKEMITEGENGYLVKFNDIKGLANRLETLINNENLRIEIGRNGRSRLLKKYSLNDKLEAIVRHYC